MDVLNFVLGAIVTLIIVSVVRIVNQNRELKRKLADMAERPQLDQDFWRELKKISAALTFMVQGQQLSTVFELGPKSLRVRPEDFEPNKEQLRKNMLRIVVEESHPQPNTWAFCVLDHSGWRQFVDSETYSQAQNALGRLRANDDKEAILNLVNDLVDQLSPSPAAA